MSTLMITEEKETVSAWMSGVLAGKAPFSFIYGDIPSQDFLEKWYVGSNSVPAADGSVAHTVTFADTNTGLTCVLELTEYQDNPAVEWLVRFRNGGAHDTPLLSDILAADIVCGDKGVSDPILRFSKGSSAKIDDFALQEQRVAPESDVTFTSTGSRTYLPFFNMELGDDGVITSIGWTGTWKAVFGCSAEGAITFKAGLAATHLLLHPGEEIRLPRMLLLFWHGDRIRAHNMLRRHLVANHLPHPGGKEVEAPICNSTWGGMKTHNHLKTIRFIKDHNLDYDFYWIDAGWFGPDHETEEFQNFHTEDWAYHMGIWRVNRLVHPDGLKPIVDAVHDANMQLLLWFAPFMGVEGSPWQQEHPEWAEDTVCWGDNGIGMNPTKVAIRRIMFRDPAAGKWLADYIGSLMDEHGVDNYREDIGMPGSGDDAPDRQGMGEIKAIENFYAYWDELLRRKPNMLIDNCSGGGTRVDLETMGRSLVLHRSDYNCDPNADPIGSQVMTYGLAHWAPLVGGGTPAAPGNTYNFRSGLSGGMAFSLFHPCGFGDAPTEPQVNYPIEWHREMLTQFRRTRRFFKGDFYPLTDCTLSDEVWMAYQLDRPGDGEGMVVAFRRKHSPYPSAEFKLQGIDPSAQYEIDNVDTGEVSRCSGDHLSDGLPVSIPGKAESRLIFYRRI